MTFDSTQPSSTSGTLAQALTGTNANLNDLNNRLSTIEGANTVAVASEVATARGSMSSLNARLSTSLDAYGNLLFSSLTSLLWIQTAVTTVYVSGNTFTVAGNLTNSFPAGQLMSFALGASQTVYSPIASSSYSGGSGTTTVTLTYSVLTNALTAAYYGVAIGPQGAPGINFCAAGGSANAITGSVANVSQANGVLVFAQLANPISSTTPTFAFNGNTAATITARGGQALVLTDMPHAGFVAQLEYNAAGTRWELMNPAPVSTAVANSWTANQTFSGAALDEAQGASIASASSINLETATGNYLHITGTTAITSITLNQGAERTVVFDGVLTLTNGASLILPSGGNILTGAGDSAQFRGEAGGVVRCIEYQPAHGANIATQAAFVQNKWFS